MPPLHRLLAAALLAAAFLFAWTPARAQSAPPPADLQAIRAMGGCYEVSFRYAETFRTDTAYAFHENYTAAALEYVHVQQRSPRHLQLQHLLIVGEGTVIKHWRQDWVYEPNGLYSFTKPRHWTHQPLAADTAAGRWAQHVYQVDDGPRYAGIGHWDHQGPHSQWVSWADAPLPRREFSKRSDYNVLRRRNRHAILDNGWLHDQDNQKVLRQGGTDSVLVWEKGRNAYRAADRSRCEPAITWWKEHGPFWAKVRRAWAEVYERNEDMVFRAPEEGQPTRWQQLFALDREEGASATMAGIREVLRANLAE